MDIVADLEKPLPLPNDEYDMVYSQFAIEHISWRNLKQFIGEVHRILNQGGRAVIVTANLMEQARVLVQKQEWDINDLCMVFGDQNYPENTHRSSMSPELARRLFKEAGFSTVNIVPLPNCQTDMVIEAYKSPHYSKEEILWVESLE